MAALVDEVDQEFEEIDLIADELPDDQEERFLELADADRDLTDEEARELAEARDRDNVVWEAADVIYFTTAALAKQGVSIAEVMAELDRRGLQTRRRDGSSTFAAGEDG